MDRREGRPRGRQDGQEGRQDRRDVQGRQGRRQARREAVRDPDRRRRRPRRLQEDPLVVRRRHGDAVRQPRRPGRHAGDRHSAEDPRHERDRQRRGRPDRPAGRRGDPAGVAAAGRLLVATPPETDLWDLRNLARARRLCDFMSEQLPRDPGPRAVEVGAGIGTFSARLLGAGVRELLLVEPEAACVRELETRFAGDERVAIRAETLPDAPSLAERPGHFDFALAQNVLEHIADDHGAMAAMARALRPGGRLMALVPAHPRLYGSLDRAYGHERRYTPHRLRGIVEPAGLVVERLYFFNALGVLGWWARSRIGSRGIGSRSLRAYELLLAAWRPVERRLDLRFGL